MHFDGTAGLFSGWPQLSPEGKYLGPLPRECGHSTHKQLIGASKDGTFLTGPAAAYPAAMCRMLAEVIVDNILKMGRSRPTLTLSSSPATPPTSSARLSSPPSLSPPPLSRAGPGDEVDLLSEAEEEPVAALPDTSSEDEEGFKRTRRNDAAFGFGPPMTVRWGGLAKTREYSDGKGLCSPARWHPDRRKARGTFAESLFDVLKKAVIEKFPDPRREIATGRLAESPFTPSELTDLRTPDPVRASTIADFQPLSTCQPVGKRCRSWVTLIGESSRRQSTHIPRACRWESALKACQGCRLFSGVRCRGASWTLA